MSAKGFDGKCLELAEYFLADNQRRYPNDASELAQQIQDTVEMFATPCDCGYCESCDKRSAIGDKHQ